MSFSAEIKNARKTAQVDRIAKGESWYSKYFVRYFSIYVSYLFCKVGISGNAVTVMMGIVGLWGSACIVFDNLWHNILGAILWQLWFVLDCVDGEVARLQKKTSIFGIYLDELTHTIVNPTFVLALGLHVYLKESSIVNLAAMIAIYSTWHWKRQLGRSVRTTVEIKSGVKMTNSAKMHQKKADRKIYYYLRRTLLRCFGDVDAMLFISAAIVLDHVTGYDITKWWLYLYAILLFLFVAALILRERRKVIQLDLNERQA